MGEGVTHKQRRVSLQMLRSDAHKCMKRENKGFIPPVSILHLSRPYYLSIVIDVHIRLSIHPTETTYRSAGL